MAFFSFPINTLAVDENANAVPAKNIQVIINENKINMGNTNAYYLYGHLLLPLRLLFESMGSQVDWNAVNKSIRAERNGTVVELTLNSSVAYINGAEVVLETRAAAISGNTYVPLRFVGEAFGGTVNWDDSARTASIVLPDQAIRKASDLKISINNTAVNFSVNPLIINNIKYLPLDEFLDKLTLALPVEYNLSWAKNDDGAYIVYFDGVARMFSPDQPLLYVNGTQTGLRSYPITYDGYVYMPLKMAEEVLNATVYYDTDTKINYIYIVRSKFKTDFLTTTGENGILPVNIPSAELRGDRILTVSDDPEVIDPAILKKESAVLWLSNPVTVLGKTSQEHRVFGWHINDMGTNLRIGIVIENIDNTVLTVSDTRHFTRTTSNSWAEYDVGLPIAEAVLNNSMNITLPTEIKINPGERFLLQEFSVKDGCLIGFINDFSITNNNKSAKGKYKVWIVVDTADNDLREIDGSPLAIKKAKYHTRGNWAASQINATTPVYVVDGAQVAYSISNGITDNFYTVKKSLANGYTATSNIGHFGATYLVDIPIDNQDKKTRAVRVQLSSRGGVYAGAVRNPDGVFLVPEMKAMNGMANIYTYQAPPGKSVLTIEIMHGGGSYLPVAINLSTVPQE